MLLKSPARAAIGSLFIVLILLAPRVVAAQGKILLAMTEVEADGTASYWWSSTLEPKWTDSDLSVRAMLDELGLSVVDPGELPEPPPISQVVYGHPHLSPTNAINLASLFGASRLITGSTRLEPVEPSPILERPGYRATLDLHVYATGTTIELLSVELEQSAWADNVEDARAAALQGAVGRLRTMFAHSASLAEAEVGIAVEEPVLVITGLERASPLVAIKRFLKTREAVDDAIEIWAAEGVIAVELNPGVVDSTELITSAVDALLLHAFDDFEVQEVRRDPDRIEVAVLPRRHLEPATPDPFDAR